MANVSYDIPSINSSFYAAINGKLQYAYFSRCTIDGETLELTITSHANDDESVDVSITPTDSELFYKSYDDYKDNTLICGAVRLGDILSDTGFNRIVEVTKDGLRVQGWVVDNNVINFIYKAITGKFTLFRMDECDWRTNHELFKSTIFADREDAKWECDTKVVNADGTETIYEAEKKKWAFNDTQKAILNKLRALIKEAEEANVAFGFHSNGSELIAFNHEGYDTIDLDWRTEHEDNWVEVPERAYSHIRNVLRLDEENYAYLSNK